MEQASGFTADYTDPGSGITITNAWIQLVICSYLPYQYVVVVYQVYKDEQSKIDGMAPIFDNLRFTSKVGDDNWNTYFDPDVMDVTGHNIQKQCVSYLGAMI